MSYPRYIYIIFLFYRQESTSSAVSASCATPLSDSSLNVGQQTSTPRQYHRFSDSMTSSTSSSGFGTDVHSMRHSTSHQPHTEANSSQNPMGIPTPYMSDHPSAEDRPPSSVVPGSNPANASQILSQVPPSIIKQASRKSKTKETSPLSSKAKRSSSKRKKNCSSANLSGSVLDQVDVRKACLDMLVYTSSTSDDPKVAEKRGKELLRAGSVDALIVLATQSVKNDFLYQEAFIATYRTFVSTHDLLEKLVQRFRKFNNRRDEQQVIYKRVAHCAFSLMVSVETLKINYKSSTKARGDCKRPCFDKLHAHILEHQTNSKSYTMCKFS